MNARKPRFYGLLAHRRALVTSSILIIASVFLPPTVARCDAVPPRPTCQVSITSPIDGATSVPLDTEIVGTASNCTTIAPIFIDDLGTDIAASITLADNKFVVRPVAALQPNRTYSLQFGEPPVCGIDRQHARFTTARTPTLRSVNVSGQDAEIVALDLSLSEPVMDASDLAVGSPFISVTIRGFSGTPLDNSGGKLKTAGMQTTKFSRYYKRLVNRPQVDMMLCVRLLPGLRFASGEVLTKAVRIDLRLTQSRGEIWHAGERAPVCDAGLFGGCSVATGGGGQRPRHVGVIGLLLVGLLALGARRLATLRLGYTAAWVDCGLGRLRLATLR